MGKKINYKTKGKADKNAKKDLQPATREMIINLHKQLHGEKFKKKAPKAVKVIRELAKRMMFTKDVRVDPELNKELWKNGIRNVMTRVKVILERKKNEEDDEAEEKMYTLVKLAPLFGQ
jgi:large subunit ribosomal protein L31e